MYSKIAFTFAESFTLRSTNLNYVPGNFRWKNP